MTLEDLRNLVDAYGSDPGRWPDDRRDAAEALVERSADARDIVEDARMVDDLLAAMPEVAVRPALRSQIGDLPRQHKQERKKRRASGWSFGVGHLIPQLAGAAAALALGFYLGTLNVVPVDSPFQVANTEVVDLVDYVYGEDLPEGIEL